MTTTKPSLATRKGAISNFAVGSIGRSDEMYARTLSAWLARDDDKLLEFVFGGDDDVSLYEMSEALQREPFSVLCRLREGELSTMAAFDFERGSEEEAELFGLALAGVPIGMALRWCVGADDRPTTAQLEAAMTRPDLRSALTMAREADLWVCNTSQVTALLFLVQQPIHLVLAAVRSVVDRFDAPTPNVVAQQMFGVIPNQGYPVSWSGTNRCSSGRYSPYSGAKRRSYTKPFRSARRSTLRRSSATTSRGRAKRA